MKSFMAITFHFVNDDFQLKSGLMDFVPLSGKHDGANIAKTLENTFSELGLSKSQVFTATVDNASSNDTMMSTLIANG